MRKLKSRFIHTALVDCKDIVDCDDKYYKQVKVGQSNPIKRSKLVFAFV